LNEALVTAALYLDARELKSVCNKAVFYGRSPRR
jgi:hypothetical protein